MPKNEIFINEHGVPVFMLNGYQVCASQAARDAGSIMNEEKPYVFRVPLPLSASGLKEFVVQLCQRYSREIVCATNLYKNTPDTAILKAQAHINEAARTGDKTDIQRAAAWAFVAAMLTDENIKFLVAKKLKDDCEAVTTE